MNLQDEFKRIKVEGNVLDLESILLACINEREETGLNYIIDLISIKDSAPFEGVCIQASALATTYWGIEGLSRLAQAAISLNRVSTTINILVLLSYASCGALDHFIEQQVVLYKFPNLQARLNLKQENYWSV